MSPSSHSSPLPIMYGLAVCLLLGDYLTGEEVLQLLWW